LGLSVPNWRSCFQFGSSFMAMTFPSRVSMATPSFMWTRLPSGENMRIQPLPATASVFPSLSA